jgi:hypothetical protein
MRVRLKFLSLYHGDRLNFDTLHSDSFPCAKEAVTGTWMQWLLIVVATVLLCIPLSGYTLEV